MIFLSANPHFPALRSGHRLFQRPSPQKQFPSNETYQWPLSSFIPGVLQQFDLPDCYHGLEAKKLRQIEPSGANAGIA